MSRFRRVIAPERLSIGVVTSTMDPRVMLRIFAGTQSGASGVSLELDVDSPDELGAAVSMMRGEHRSWEHAYEPVRVDR